MKRCYTCEIISEALGKRLFERYFFKYNKIEKKEIDALLYDLNLRVVGGLLKKGWTVHDIDIVGSSEDVLKFVERLKKHQITNPVHFCGSDKNHSHFKCLWNGLKILLGGKNY